MDGKAAHYCKSNWENARKNTERDMDRDRIGSAMRSIWKESRLTNYQWETGRLVGTIGERYLPEKGDDWVVRPTLKAIGGVVHTVSGALDSLISDAGKGLTRDRRELQSYGSHTRIGTEAGETVERLIPNPVGAITKLPKLIGNVIPDGYDALTGMNVGTRRSIRNLDRSNEFSLGL